MEKGGQGLVHLASRRAAFRLLFVQRYLTGPMDLVWRKVADIIFNKVSGLNLNSVLFLTDLQITANYSLIHPCQFNSTKDFLMFGSYLEARHNISVLAA